MSIRTLCHRGAVTVDAAASLAEAAHLMREHEVGALVVTSEADGGHRVSGIVTDRDLALEGLTREASVPTLRVGDIARHRLVAVRADAELNQAAQLMLQYGVRRLVVVEGDAQLAGVVSIDDIVGAIAAQLDAVAGAMLRVCGTPGSGEAAAPAPVPSSSVPQPSRRVVFLPMGTPGMH